LVQDLSDGVRGSTADHQLNVEYLIIGRSYAAIRVDEHAGFVAIECASRPHGWLQPLVLRASVAGNRVFNGGMGIPSGSSDGSLGGFDMRES